MDMAHLVASIAVYVLLMSAVFSLTALMVLHVAKKYHEFKRGIK